jgi:LmbE family N-acetylglucosaminyl deacetylase
MITKATVVVQNVTPSKYPPVIEDFEGWTEPKRILIFLAHPDDPEFFCGASLYRWIQAGHEVRYCLFTSGQRGSQDINLSIEQISKIRKNEQQKAANYLGVKSIDYLDEIDGELFSSMRLREETVKLIRKYSPQIIVTSDPQNYVTLENRVNHPDHRAAGEIVLGAAFPAAGNAQIYKSANNTPMGIPVDPQEIWLSATNQPDLIVDVTDYFDKKIDAISCHVSQVGEKQAFAERMKTRSIIHPRTKLPIYIERFKRIILN